MKKNVVAIFAILLALSAVLNIYQYFGNTGKSAKRSLDPNLINSCKLEIMGTAEKTSGDILWTVCDVNKDGQYDILLIAVDNDTAVYKLNSKDAVKITDISGHDFCRCFNDPMVLSSMIKSENESKLLVYEFTKDFSSVKVREEYATTADAYTLNGNSIDKATYETAESKYFDKSNAILQIPRTDNWYLDACFNEAFQ
ncbi:MAG: hypothetical protein K5756_10405 [Clostridiales bacterium]|nr:hypothetical protein [Clostridiales bacterium]